MELKNKRPIGFYLGPYGMYSKRILVRDSIQNTRVMPKPFKREHLLNMLHREVLGLGAGLGDMYCSKTPLPDIPEILKSNRLNTE